MNKIKKFLDNILNKLISRHFEKERKILNRRIEEAYKNDHI